MHQLMSSSMWTHICRSFCLWELWEQLWELWEECWELWEQLWEPWQRWFTGLQDVLEFVFILTQDSTLLLKIERLTFCRVTKNNRDLLSAGCP